MWILLLLILPIWLVFGWIHLRLFPHRKPWLDAVLVMAPLVLAMSLGILLLHILGTEPGLWDEIMAALAAYLTLAVGFGLALAVRRFLTR